MSFKAHYFLAVPIPPELRNMLYIQIKSEESVLCF
jgi:hypothetical protein